MLGHDLGCGVILTFTAFSVVSYCPQMELLQVVDREHGGVCAQDLGSGMLLFICGVVMAYLPNFC